RGALSVDVLFTAEQLAGEVCATDVEKQIAADVLESHDGRGQQVDQREAELEIRVARARADERADRHAADVVQSAEVVEVREASRRVAKEQARREQGARGELKILPRVDAHVARQRAAALRARRIVGGKLVAMSRDRAELLEHGGVAAERAADDGEVVAAVDQKEIAELVDLRVVDVARLVAGADVEAVVTIERIADDADGAGLAEELSAVHLGGEDVGGRDVERAVVEDAESPVRAVLQIEVQHVEVRERGDGVELRDQPAIAQHVAHEDDRLGDQELIRGDAAVDLHVVDEEAAAARLLDLLRIDRHFHRRLEGRPRDRKSTRLN